MLESQSLGAFQGRDLLFRKELLSTTIGVAVNSGLMFLSGVGHASEMRSHFRNTVKRER